MGRGAGGDETGDADGDGGGVRVCSPRGAIHARVVVQAARRSHLRRGCGAEHAEEPGRRVGDPRGHTGQPRRG